jgi:hypothetical protein
MRLLFPLCLLVTCAACVQMPESYAPPVQRRPALSGEAPKTAKRLLRMTDAETDAYVVQDIPKGANGPWRWAGRKPTVRIFLSNTAANDPNTIMLVEYSVAEATFKDTGPVTFQFLVNGQKLGEERQEKPGAYTFSKVIPNGWLKSGENDLAVEIDKPWKSPTDGAELGFILTAIGFVQ